MIIYLVFKFQDGFIHRADDCGFEREMFKEERAMIVRKAEKKKKKQKSLISQKSSEGNVSNKSDYD